MLKIFRVLGERLATMFATHVALDFERQFLSLQSDRKVELLQKADELEAQGRPEVATELREQAAGLQIDRPMASTASAALEFEQSIAVTTLPPDAPRRLEADSSPPRPRKRRTSSRK